MLEVVVAHELAQAFHPDHGADFRALLRRVCPTVEGADAFLAGALWVARRWSSPPPVERRFSHLECFQRGTQGRTRVLLEGEGWRGRVVIDDHVFTIGSGNSRSQHRHAVRLVSSPRLVLSDFLLRRENLLFDRVGELSGGQDIDCEEDFDFARAYLLRGSDEAKVRGVFSVAVRHFLLHDVGRTIAVEGRNDTPLAHMGKLLRPEKARTLLHTTQELAHLLGARAFPRTSVALSTAAKFTQARNTQLGDLHQRLLANVPQPPTPEAVATPLLPRRLRRKRALRYKVSAHPR